jgi:hypothetical protein
MRRREESPTGTQRNAKQNLGPSLTAEELAKPLPQPLTYLVECALPGEPVEVSSLATLGTRDPEHGLLITSFAVDDAKNVPARTAMVFSRSGARLFFGFGSKLLSFSLATGILTTECNVVGNIVALGIVPSSGDVVIAHGNQLSLLASNGSISALAGSTSTGGVDATGAAASFYDIKSLVVVGLYVYVSSYYTVRRVTLPHGVVTTFAGLGGHAGYVDGPGPSARFTDLRQLDYDPTDGCLYVCDFGSVCLIFVASVLCAD